MSPGRQAAGRQEAKSPSRENRHGGGGGEEANEGAGQCPGCTGDPLGSEGSEHGEAKVGVKLLRRC